MKEFESRGGVPPSHPHTQDPPMLLSQFIDWSPREGASLPATPIPRIHQCYCRNLFIGPRGRGRPSQPPPYPGSTNAIVAIYLLVPEGGDVPPSHPHTQDPPMLLSQFIYWSPREGASLPATHISRIHQCYCRNLFIGPAGGTFKLLNNLDPGGCVSGAPLWSANATGWRWYK